MFTKILIASAILATSACDAYADEALTRFDVAEDHTQFTFADAPIHESGMPAHGNPFITRGYIYPAGTLAGNLVGVLEDGSPAYPDRVLGIWTCDGWFVGDGGDATTGVWLVSRQIMLFNDGDVIITQGTELADAGVANTRPITGATGDYSVFNDGVMMQTLIGFTEHFGVNATFEIPTTEDHAALQ